MDSHKLFANTPPLRMFFIAAIPGAVSMLASALYQMFDGIFVGQFLGATEFAALNLAMPFVIINFSLADLIGVGSAVPISVSLGRKLDKEANNIFTCACLMIFMAGIIVGAVLFAAAPLLMRLMGAEGEFAEFALQYLRVYAICSPVTTIVFAMDNFLRISGIIRGSMFLNIFMSVLSGTLEFLFLGVFGFGIWGAALATCLGMIASACLALIPFIRGKATLRFCRPRFSWAMIRQIIACGSPNFLNNIAGRITSILLNFILVRLGGERAVSVYGILMYVDGFIQPLLYGMCDSLQPAVGYNWEQENIQESALLKNAALLPAPLYHWLLLWLFFCSRNVGPVIYERRRGRIYCHGGRGPGAVLYHICYPVVFFCHTELYAGCRKAPSGFYYFRSYSVGVSGDLSGSPVAFGTYRYLAEPSGDGCTGSNPGLYHFNEIQEGTSPAGCRCPGIVATLWLL